MTKEMEGVWLELAEVLPADELAQGLHARHLRELMTALNRHPDRLRTFLNTLGDASLARVIACLLECGQPSAGADLERWTSALALALDAWELTYGGQVVQALAKGPALTLEEALGRYHQIHAKG